MTEPTRDALHEEEMPADGVVWYLNAMRSALDDNATNKARRDVLAYAAECVQRVPELEAEVERLTASNRKLTTMLEEEAYHRMAAENRAEPDSGNVRIEVTDSAEVERLRAKAAIVVTDEMVEAGLGALYGRLRLTGINPKFVPDFKVVALRDDVRAVVVAALAAYAAATREGTDD